MRNVRRRSHNCNQIPTKVRNEIVGKKPGRQGYNKGGKSAIQCAALPSLAPPRRPCLTATLT